MLALFGSDTCKAIRSIGLSKWTARETRRENLESDLFIKTAEKLVLARMPVLQEIHVSVRSSGGWYVRDQFLMFRAKMEEWSEKNGLHIYVTELDQWGEVMEPEP
jgi:hypothetical protein